MTQSTKSGSAVANKQHVAPQVGGALSWDDLRVFHAVAAAGSVRKAAVQLDVNASTVSRRISVLERALQALLFERSPEGLRLTAAGEEVQAFAERLREDVQQLTRQVKGRDQQLDGVVRLSVAQAAGPVVFASLEPFLRDHGRVRIEIAVSDVVSDVNRHEADVVVRCANDPGEQLVGRRLGKNGTYLCASREYLAQAAYPLESAEHHWLDWPEVVHRKPAYQWLAAEYPTRHVALRADSGSAVLEAARRGLGIAPLTTLQLYQQAELVVLRPFPPECSTAVWLLTHRDVRHSARVRALLDHLGASVAGALARD